MPTTVAKLSRSLSQESYVLLRRATGSYIYRLIFIFSVRFVFICYWPTVDLVYSRVAKPNMKTIQPTVSMLKTINFQITAQRATGKTCINNGETAQRQFGLDPNAGRCIDRCQEKRQRQVTVAY